MAFEIPKISYNGVIREIALGNEANPLIVGGETSYPFHLFEGEMPHTPKIAMDVYDAPPEEWPQALLDPLGDVINDPAASRSTTNRVAVEKNAEGRVHLTVTHEAEQYELTLFVEKVGRRHRIVDITFLGALLSRNYRGTINGIVRRHGVAELLARIRARMNAPQKNRDGLL